MMEARRKNSWGQGPTVAPADDATEKQQLLLAVQTAAERRSQTTCAIIYRIR